MFEKLKRIYEKIIGAIKPKNKILQIGVLNYEQVIELMEEKGLYAEFEKELNNFDDIEELMNNKTNLHGINHVVRVLFNTYAIVTLENTADKDRKVIIEAAKLHDIGRISDGEDREHGNQGVIKARKVLEDKGFLSEEIDLICFLIKEHSLSKKENDEHIQELPEGIRQRYEYCLNLLKDADKLDRVRLGDLDTKRLSTDSAKRLISVSQDIFYNNRYYYKKKIKVYPFNEKDARQIFEEIKRQVPDLEIDFENIKKNYSKFKVLQQQGKIEWIKDKSDNISLNDFIEIISVVSKEDMKYLKDEFWSGNVLIINAIYDMGIDKFMELKSNGKLQNFMHIDNFQGTVGKLTQEEKDLLMSFRRYDFAHQVTDKFYLYYRFIKVATPEEIKLLQLNSKDRREYKDGTNNKEYKWRNSRIYLAAESEMAVIENTDPELLLDIREKLNIPANIIITAIIDLNLIEDAKELERKAFEKILINYYKLELDVRAKKDKEQIKTLLLDLPDDMDEKYYSKVRQCTIGRFKTLKLDKFEQVQDCERICEQKILEEFEQNDNINDIRKLILLTKSKDLNGIKRDIYFYKKYMCEKAQENIIVNLFETLFTSQDKRQLLEAYNELNSMKEGFYLDEALVQIREDLSHISREDVVSKMNDMKQKIEDLPTSEIQGKEVVNLTGTDFNLLISVIAGSGSPYLVSYYNRTVENLKKFEGREKLYNIMRTKMELDLKIGTRRLVNKRYKLDPLKNKQRCVSSIDQDFIGHISSNQEEIRGKEKQIEEKLILVYFPQNQDDISYMGNEDLMTSYNKDRTDNTRKRVPHKDNMGGVCNLKLEDLNATTIGNDNEIVVDTYPGAVICFDRVSNIAVRTAKRLNIPVLYIDSMKQFEIIKNKLDEYYADIKNKICGNSYITDETFLEAFNMFEGNVIHDAFKLAHGFSYLDDDEYPIEQILEIINKMGNLVDESLKRCNPSQREIIQKIMLKEANPFNVRYGNYYKYIDFDALINLVLEKEYDDSKQKE